MGCGSNNGFIVSTSLSPSASPLPSTSLSPSAKLTISASPSPSTSLLPDPSPSLSAGPIVSPSTNPNTSPLLYTSPSLSACPFVGASPNPSTSPQRHLPELPTCTAMMLVWRTPSVTAMHHMQNDLAAQAAKETKPTSYREWIQQVQSTRNSDWKMNVAFSKA